MQRARIFQKDITIGEYQVVWEFMGIAGQQILFPNIRLDVEIDGKFMLSASPWDAYCEFITSQQSYQFPLTSEDLDGYDGEIAIALPSLLPPGFYNYHMSAVILTDDTMPIVGCCLVGEDIIGRFTSIPLDGTTMPVCQP